MNTTTWPREAGKFIDEAQNYKITCDKVDICVIAWNDRNLCEIWQVKKLALQSSNVQTNYN